MALDQHAPEVRALLVDLRAEVEKKRDGLERKGKTHDEIVFLQGEIKSLRNIINKLTSTGDDDE